MGAKTLATKLDVFTELSGELNAKVACPLAGVAMHAGAPAQGRMLAGKLFRAD